MIGHNLEAFCSGTCAVLPKKKEVLKNVSKNAKSCPDCKTVLDWRRPSENRKITEKYKNKREK